MYKRQVVVLLSLASTAIPTALLGIVQSPVIACIVLFQVGLGIVAFEVVSVMLLQRLTRREMSGRVFGLVGTATNAGKLLGAVLTPAVVIALGLTTTLVLLGTVVAVAGVFCGPALVRMSRESRRSAAKMRPIVRTLSTLGVFDGASPFALEQVAAALRTEHFDDGTVVLAEGDPADDMFVIRSGRFVVTAHGQQIDALRDGDWFGEIGLLQRRGRTATVIAATDAEVWRIPGAVFLSALEEGAAEPTALMEVMAARLGRTAAAAASAPNTPTSAT